MNCPACRANIALSWSRYLRSVSGRHTCPACTTMFRFKLTKAYLMLWLDIIALALLTMAVVRAVLLGPYGYAANDPLVAGLAVAVPVCVWGGVFLVLNRRALDRLATRAVGPSACRRAPPDPHGAGPGTPAWLTKRR